MDLTNDHGETWLVRRIHFHNSVEILTKEEYGTASYVDLL